MSTYRDKKVKNNPVDLNSTLASKKPNTLGKFDIANPYRRDEDEINENKANDDNQKVKMSKNSNSKVYEIKGIASRIKEELLKKKNISKDSDQLENDNEEMLGKNFSNTNKLPDRSNKDKEEIDQETKALIFNKLAISDSKEIKNFQNFMSSECSPTIISHNNPYSNSNCNSVIPSSRNLSKNITPSRLNSKSIKNDSKTNLDSSTINKAALSLKNASDTNINKDVKTKQGNNNVTYLNKIRLSNSYGKLPKSILRNNNNRRHISFNPNKSDPQDKDKNGKSRNTIENTNRVINNNFPSSYSTYNNNPYLTNNQYLSSFSQQPVNTISQYDTPVLNTNPGIYNRNLTYSSNTNNGAYTNTYDTNTNNNVVFTAPNNNYPINSAFYSYNNPNTQQPRFYSYNKNYSNNNNFNNVYNTSKNNYYVNVYANNQANQINQTISSRNDTQKNNFPEISKINPVSQINKTITSSSRNNINNNPYNNAQTNINPNLYNNQLNNTNVPINFTSNRISASASHYLNNNMSNSNNNNYGNIRPPSHLTNTISSNDNKLKINQLQSINTIDECNLHENHEESNSNNISQISITEKNIPVNLSQDDITDNTQNFLPYKKQRIIGSPDANRDAKRNYTNTEMENINLLNKSNNEYRQDTLIQRTYNPNANMNNLRLDIMNNELETDLEKQRELYSQRLHNELDQRTHKNHENNGISIQNHEDYEDGPINNQDLLVDEMEDNENISYKQVSHNNEISDNEMIDDNPNVKVYLNTNEINNPLIPNYISNNTDESINNYNNVNSVGDQINNNELDNEYINYNQYNIHSQYDYMMNNNINDFYYNNNSVYELKKKRNFHFAYIPNNNEDNDEYHLKIKNNKKYLQGLQISSNLDKKFDSINYNTDKKLANKYVYFHNEHQINDNSFINPSNSMYRVGVYGIYNKSVSKLSDFILRSRSKKEQGLENKRRLALSCNKEIKRDQKETVDVRKLVLENLKKNSRNNNNSELNTASQEGFISNIQDSITSNNKVDSSKNQNNDLEKIPNIKSLDYYSRKHYVKNKKNNDKSGSLVKKKSALINNLQTINNKKGKIISSVQKNNSEEEEKNRNFILGKYSIKEFSYNPIIQKYKDSKLRKKIIPRKNKILLEDKTRNNTVSKYPGIESPNVLDKNKSVISEDSNEDETRGGAVSLCKSLHRKKKNYYMRNNVKQVKNTSAFNLIKNPKTFSFDYSLKLKTICAEIIQSNFRRWFYRRKYAITTVQRFSRGFIIRSKLAQYLSTFYNMKYRLYAINKIFNSHLCKSFFVNLSGGEEEYEKFNRIKCIVRLQRAVKKFYKMRIHSDSTSEKSKQSVQNKDQKINRNLRAGKKPKKVMDMEIEKELLTEKIIMKQEISTKPFVYNKENKMLLRKDQYFVRNGEIIYEILGEDKPETNEQGFTFKPMTEDKESHVKPETRNQESDIMSEKDKKEEIQVNHKNLRSGKPKIKKINIEEEPLTGKIISKQEILTDPIIFNKESKMLVKKDHYLVRNEEITYEILGEDRPETNNQESDLNSKKQNKNLRSGKPKNKKINIEEEPLTEKIISKQEILTEPIVYHKENKMLLKKDHYLVRNEEITYEILGEDKPETNEQGFTFKPFTEEKESHVKPETRNQESDVMSEKEIKEDIQVNHKNLRSGKPKNTKNTVKEEPIKERIISKQEIFTEPIVYNKVNKMLLRKDLYFMRNEEITYEILGEDKPETNEQGFTFKPFTEEKESHVKPETKNQESDAMSEKDIKEEIQVNHKNLRSGKPKNKKINIEEEPLTEKIIVKQEILTEPKVYKKVNKMLLRKDHYLVRNEEITYEILGEDKPKTNIQESDAMSKKEEIQVSYKSLNDLCIDAIVIKDDSKLITKRDNYYLKSEEIVYEILGERRVHNKLEIINESNFELFEIDSISSKSTCFELASCQEQFEIISKEKETEKELNTQSEKKEVIQDKSLKIFKSYDNFNLFKKTVAKRKPRLCSYSDHNSQAINEENERIIYESKIKNSFINSSNPYLASTFISNNETQFQSMIKDESQINESVLAKTNDDKVCCVSFIQPRISISCTSYFTKSHLIEKNKDAFNKSLLTVISLQRKFRNVLLMKKQNAKTINSRNTYTIDTNTIEYTTDNKTIEHNIFETVNNIDQVEAFEVIDKNSDDFDDFEDFTPTKVIEGGNNTFTTTARIQPAKDNMRSKNTVCIVKPTVKNNLVVNLNKSQQKTSNTLQSRIKAIFNAKLLPALIRNKNLKKLETMKERASRLILHTYNTKHADFMLRRYLSLWRSAIYSKILERLDSLLLERMSDKQKLEDLENNNNKNIRIVLPKRITKSNNTNTETLACCKEIKPDMSNLANRVINAFRRNSEKNIKDKKQIKKATKLLTIGLMREHISFVMGISLKHFLLTKLKNIVNRKDKKLQPSNSLVLNILKRRFNLWRGISKDMSLNSHKCQLFNERIKMSLMKRFFNNMKNNSICASKKQFTRMMKVVDRRNVEITNNNLRYYFIKWWKIEKEIYQKNNSSLFVCSLFNKLNKKTPLLKEIGFEQVFKQPYLNLNNLSEKIRDNIYYANDNHVMDILKRHFLNQLNKETISHVVKGMKTTFNTAMSEVKVFEQGNLSTTDEENDNKSVQSDSSDDKEEEARKNKNNLIFNMKKFADARINKIKIGLKRKDKEEEETYESHKRNVALNFFKKSVLAKQSKNDEA